MIMIMTIINIILIITNILFNIFDFWKLTKAIKKFTVILLLQQNKYLIIIIIIVIIKNIILCYYLNYI